MAVSNLSVPVSKRELARLKNESNKVVKNNDHRVLLASARYKFIKLLPFSQGQQTVQHPDIACILTSGLKADSSG
jgi:hypothetical protein